MQDLHKIVLISSMRNICARFSPNSQYMHKICTRLYFFLQCAIYAQDLRKIVLLSPMRKICARLYFFLQCAIYVQDLRKIVLLSPMRKICARLYFFLQCAIYVQDLRKIVILSPMPNICARFVQDCSYFSNAQYMCKICARL